MKIKKIISRYMVVVTFLLVVVILLFVTLGHIMVAQRQARKRAEAVFSEMQSILEENARELEVVKEEYKRNCLYNAETIAYILENDIDIIEDREELKRIAKIVQVDEIHIFDKNGMIYAGTHPEYYGLDVNSGEQISFFEPLLQDKSLQLCQEITPNTAEGKPMQYSALWSSNEEFIVQVGMEPVNVFKITEKNELSHVFGHLRVDVGVNLYAIDINTRKIVGATTESEEGVDCSSIGFEFDKLMKKGDSVHMTINGVDSYCVFTQMEGNLIGRVISTDSLYKEVPVYVAEVGVGIVIAAAILVCAVIWHMNRYVIDGIYDINERLSTIKEGNLNEKVNVHTSLEFTELSEHINSMIESILATTDKMSYVLSKSDMHIGVYEYNDKMEGVRFTEYIPKILELDKQQEMQLKTNSELFKELISEICKKPYSDEDKDVFKLDDDKYVKIEEIEENGNIFGIICDVTEDVETRIKLEIERDRDMLTGLYNRRGLENMLSKLFRDKGKLGYGALIMIDTDGLKGINDNYGHEKGDIYLRKIAGVIGTFGVKKCVSARQGGDEFILFLYDYETEADLMNDINTLKYIQDKSSVHLDMNLKVPLSFSFGYAMLNEDDGYEELIKQADDLMYKNKRERKESRQKV